jgi:hypothetical protein
LKEGFLRIDLRNPLKVTVSKRNIPAPRGLSDSGRNIRHDLTGGSEQISEAWKERFRGLV